MRVVFLACALWLICIEGPRLAAQATSSAQSVSRPLTDATPRQIVDRYCISCHNAKLRTAGLALDTASITLDRPGENAKIWEGVVRKLRGRAMPPVGRPRPDESTYESVAAWLEDELDRAAAAAPNPGSQPAVRRLTRTEYKNAIRDLLALGTQPAEIDPEFLLPPDEAAGGFDNVADVLYVSPAAMEAYLAAARKISRFAVGDPTLPVIVDVHASPLELPQDQHLEGLPFGTRGGTIVSAYPPLDGDYVVEVEIAGRVPEPHQLEISVDGVRVELFSLGPKQTARSALGAQYSTVDGKIEARLRLKAGPKSVAVTFLEKTAAPHEMLRRPFRRSRGQQPAVARVTISGPMNASGPGDTPSRRRIFVCRPAGSSENVACATEILSSLTRLAHRRPVTDADLGFLLPFYHAGESEGGFETGIQRALERLLVSPEFLFRIERTPSNAGVGGVHRITDLELATRLSFFLWSSLPDDELLRVATANNLREPSVLDRQVRRMLADQRSKALVTNFASQWLYLRDLEIKRQDDGLFPDFDSGLKQAFQRETEMLLEAVLREDRSVLDLLTADFTFVNERLAKHYGIANVYGDHFRRVTLTDLPRRGLLGHGSMLTLTAYPTRTSPVLRGKWVLENILASPPPPPPPNVPALKDTNESGKILSMRDRMVQHRANPVCASCHALMDPIGLALENYDATGAWRTHGESGDPLDVSGALPDGTKFSGAAGLQEVLLRHPERFAATVSEKLLSYALGRHIEPSDPPVIREITRSAKAANYRLSSLIAGIAKSVPFQMRSSD